MGGAGDEGDSAQGDGEGERGRHWGKHADKRQQARATDGTEYRRNRRSGVEVDGNGETLDPMERCLNNPPYAPLPCRGNQTRVHGGSPLRWDWDLLSQGRGFEVCSFRRRFHPPTDVSLNLLLEPDSHGMTTPPGHPRVQLEQGRDSAG
jgi:hypothetical protein